MTKVSELTSLDEGPDPLDEVLLRDVSEAAADESKRILLVELLNPEKFTATTLPAAADELFINDGGTGRKITHDDLLFGANTTPSTLAHSGAAAIGTALDAARADHDHGMPAAGGVTQAVQGSVEAETNENTYTPPDLLKHTPGASKAWLSLNETGTTIKNSYNIASAQRDAEGDFSCAIDIDYAGTPAALITVQGAVSQNVNINAIAVGTVDWLSFNNTNTVNDEQTDLVTYGTQV